MLGRFNFIAAITMSLTSLGLASAFVMREHTSEDPHYVLAVIFGIALGALLGFLLVILLFAIAKSIKEKFSLEAPE